MDIKILRNFVEIVDSGSLTAASKKLFIAQPALSNQLKALETELNTVLILRNSRNQKLTDAGRLFYERAKSIVLLEKSMIQEIADVQDGEVGCLRIGTIHSGEVSLLQEVLPRFIESHPKVTFEIFEKESHVLLEMLESGKVDMALVRTPCRITEEMEAYSISDERLYYVYDPTKFSFPQGKNSLSLKELSGKPLLIIKRYEEMYRSLCEQEGISPGIRCVNHDLEISLRWAEAGLGIAVLPGDFLIRCTKTMAVRDMEGAGIVTKRTLVTMKNSFHSKAMVHFLELCRNHL